MSLPMFEANIMHHVHDQINMTRTNSERVRVSKIFTCVAIVNAYVKKFVLDSTFSMQTAFLYDNSLRLKTPGAHPVMYMTRLTSS